MHRRRFMEILAATSGWAMAGPQAKADANAPAGTGDTYTLSGLFPPLPPVSSVVACPLPDGLPWETVTALTCFQGLVNRVKPRIYFVKDEFDRYWLDHYKTKFKVKVTEIEDAFLLFDRFDGVCKGLTICDEALQDTVNVAMMQGSLDGTIPGSPSLAAQLKKYGLEPLDDLRGRWSNRRDLYAWALDSLFPKCNPRLIGGACVDYPNWTATGVFMRDFLVAHQVFTCDLSASLRDREEYALSERVFAAAQQPGCAIGWRCICCNEHEYVAMAARHGHSVLCALGCRNITVHQAIEKPKRTITQKHKHRDDLSETQDKAYIAFMNTDGDAIWSMLQRNGKRFDEPVHGSIPYNWGVLPIAIDLMPGVLDHLYELKTDNDYFVAPTNGALYTYPYLHPDMAGYLRETRRYMEAAGLRTAYMANWDDDHWWQEVDLPEFVPVLRRELPECLGFVRGMGASAFERDYLGGGAPYIYCGEAIHRHSDVYKTLRDFMDANPNRPLFWYCLVNHNVTLATIKEAVDRFSKDEIEVVHLDELFLRVRDAYESGRIGGETLYPDKRGVIEIQQKEAREAWPTLCTTIAEHAKRAAVAEDALLKSIVDPVLGPPIKHGSVTASDIILHTAIWDSMSLTRLALNVRDVYVNNKARGVEDFAIEFGDVPEAEVVPVLWDHWMGWQSRKVPYVEAMSLAERLDALAKALTARFRVL